MRTLVFGRENQAIVLVWTYLVHGVLEWIWGHPWSIEDQAITRGTTPRFVNEVHRYGYIPGARLRVLLPVTPSQYSTLAARGPAHTAVSPACPCYYAGIGYIVRLSSLYMRGLGYKCPTRTRLHVLSKHNTTTSPTVTYLVHYIRHNSNMEKYKTS